MADQAAERKPYLELQLGKTINGPNDPDIWTLDSGSIYRTSITATSVTIGGVIRTITAVHSQAGTRALTRVERTADLVAGSWYMDQSALVAGGSTNLYVWLSTSADPDSTTIVALLLFPFATESEVHPWMGAEKFTNADLETWSGGNPTGWTEVGNGVVQETSIVLSSLSSAKIGSLTLASGAFDGIQQSAVGIEGAMYRFSGYYLTPTTGQSSDVEVRVRCGRGLPLRLESDGKGLTTSDEGFALQPTWGEWRRFTFDFLWTGVTTTQLDAGLFLKNTAGATRSGLLYVDRMSFKRIHRYERYAPNLSASSIPECEIRSANNLFGPKSSGIGAVSLADADGDLAEAFASLLLFNKPATVYVGGAFPNGTEILKDDWRGAFAGLTRTPEVTDEAITFELDDATTLTRVLANANKYRLADLSSMDPAAEGTPKDYVFGETEQHKIRPKRVNLSAKGYGFYEYLDPAVPVLDNVDVDVPAGASIKVYPNHELADRNEKGYEITDFTNDIALSNNKTRWEVKRDIRNYKYDRAGNDVGTKSSFEFDVTGGLGLPIVVDLNIEGPAYKVAADLQAAMRAGIGGGDTTVTVTFDETTKKFTVARSAGALDLYMASGSTVGHKKSWALLGFDVKTNKTGAASYTGDVATFTDADEDHIIRIRSGGYRDDASGSICGTASVALSTPPAAASWLLQKALAIPATQVNVSTFAAGRTASLGEFALLFKVIEAGAVVQALADLQQVGIADLVVDGDGVWHWKRHTAGSTGAREFYDRDFLSWRMWKDPAMVHKAVRVHGDWNGSLKRHMTYGDAAGVIDTGLAVKHGTEATLEVRGDLEREYITGGTQLISNYFGRLVGKEPRCVEFACRGRLTDLLIGDKIKLTRARAFDATGAISSLAFRITGLRQNFLTGISTCTAVEDVVFLS